MNELSKLLCEKCKMQAIDFESPENYREGNY